MAVYQAPSPAADRPALPEYLGRKGDGPMDADEFRHVVQSALQESVQFVDIELSTERARATQYYQGKPFGNEEDGRSQVVLTEVRDAILGMLPSLLRIFSGPEHTVEFVPTRADTVAMAAQKTDYVRYVFEEDNNGFLEMLSVLKDGLLKKIGIFKWWWDDSAESRSYKQEGLTKAELDLLTGTDGVELTWAVKQKRNGSEQAEDLYDCEFTRTDTKGRCRVMAIPPEEFIFNRQARSLDTALLIAHRTYKTRGELLSMGIKKKDIDEHAGPGGAVDVALTTNAEELARRDAAGIGKTLGFGFSSDPEMGPANNKIAYCEADMLIDFDGDGKAELRHICTIGPVYYPVENNPTDERRFAIFTPDPEPHTLLGGSIADRTMDMQKINSSVYRAILDSAAIAAFPRTVYLEGQANVPDIMNTAIGAPIRERVQGAVRNLEQPFTGDKLLKLLEVNQEIIERRTGQNKGVAGLDDDALQSTGKEAVGAVLTSSQQQIEMIARVFADMTMKRVFKGLGRMIAKYQDRSRMIRLRGQWVDVDPRTWDDGMDVTVNVGLGSTFTEKKVATLAAVAADQEKILTTMGLNNPLVPLPKFRNTRAKILELQGIRDTENYYNKLPDDWQPPPEPQPPPDPEQQWMQAEKEMNHVATMKELAIKQDELAFKREQAIAEHALDVQKMEMELALEKYKADLQFGHDKTQAELDRALEADRAETELTIHAHDQLHDQALEREQLAHEKEMGQRAADTADMQAQTPAAE